VPFWKRQAAVLVGAHVLAGFLFLSPSYIRPDSVAVHSWLRSLVVNGDLLFFDEWAGFRMIGDGFAYFKEVTDVGALANHWWVGSSILAAPFYLVSHILSTVLPGPAFPTDGFFGLDLATLAWTSVLFHLLTFALASVTITHLAGSPPAARIVVPTIAFASLGTPAFWYAFRMPIGTHAAGMLAVGFLTVVCIHQVRGTHDETSTAGKRGPSFPFLLGLALGLAIATRLQHVVLIPAVIVALVAARARARDHGLALAGCALPLLVQGAAWLAVYGTPFGPLAAGANLEGVTWMSFHRLAFVPVLFSSWRGLFVWSPVWIPALVGLVLLVRSDDRLRRHAGVVCLLMFAGELFANATLDRYWWGGMSFGPRRFVDLALPAAIGLWAFLERFRLTGMIVSAIATVWSCLLMLAATAGTIDLARYLEWSALARGVSSAGSSLTLGLLRSPVLASTLAIQSVVAILIIAAVTAGIALLLARRPGATSTLAAAWTLLCLLAVLFAFLPTRRGAEVEMKRFKLGGEAARSAGPLIDQRGLISDELAWMEATGREQEAARTRDEIARIDAELARLGVGKPSP
jgi:hypothetical protein